MENVNNNTQAQAPLQFFNATGVRQSKAVNEEVLIAESTRSSFRIMPAVAAKLGIKDGDFVTIQFTKDGDGVVNGVYIGKGKNAVYSRDENGNIKLDERKRRIAEVDGFGALASEVTPGTNILKISVASAWDVLGDSDVKKHYTLSDEALPAQLPIGNGEFLTTDLYLLTFLKEEGKVVRTKSNKTENADTDTAPETAEQATENNTLDANTATTQQEAPISGHDADFDF